MNAMRKQWSVFVFLIGLALIVSVRAQAARAVSRSQAEALAAAINGSADLPVVVTPEVLAELNRIVSDGEERAFFRRGLAQMENYEGGIRVALAGYRFPRELLAVPLIESGYQNLAPKGQGSPCAGLWMFMPRTARNYGLEVDEQKDERLLIPVETDAAMRLLGALRLRFQDWGLALAGYNEGEVHVQEAIDASHTRDAWQLVAGGKLNHYLPRFMAAVIILHNPGLVE